MLPGAPPHGAATEAEHPAHSGRRSRLRRSQRIRAGAMFQTPSLDRLAREGIRFTNYYAGRTVCAPSRTALMTGLHTGHAWIRGNLAEHLAARRRRHDRRSCCEARLSHRPDRKVGARRIRLARDAGSAGVRLLLRLFSIRRTRTGSSPITCIATASASTTELEREYSNDLFTQRDDRRSSSAATTVRSSST